MGHRPPHERHVLHAVRVLGYADTARIAARLGVAEDEATERLLDAEARGWVAYSSYAGLGGWSLTEAGKAHGERLLAAELDRAAARAVVEEVYTEFLPLNDAVTAACTAWQLTEMGIAEHPASLPAVVARLEAPAAALAGLEARLTTRLDRFAGYHHRFAHALAAAPDDAAWITAMDRDSCHRTWFELHEDLIATLGVSR